jgi:hypothetical protein
MVFKILTGFSFLTTWATPQAVMTVSVFPQCLSQVFGISLTNWVIHFGQFKWIGGAISKEVGNGKTAKA